MSEDGYCKYGDRLWCPNLAERQTVNRSVRYFSSDVDDIVEPLEFEGHLEDMSPSKAPNILHYNSHWYQKETVGI